MNVTIQCGARTLICTDRAWPCRIGRAGFIEQSRGQEGDAKTPLGNYHIRFGLYRADRLPKPRSPLTFRPIRQDDGWCDDPSDNAYNRFVRRPYPASHEALWREDGAYDIVLIMSHNDSPPRSGRGSAVFIHVAQPDDRKTLGCIALSPNAMAGLLPLLRPDMPVVVQA